MQRCIDIIWDKKAQQVYKGKLTGKKKGINEEIDRILEKHEMD